MAEVEAALQALMSRSGAAARPAAATELAKAAGPAPTAAEATANPVKRQAPAPPGVEEIASPEKAPFPWLTYVAPVLAGVAACLAGLLLMR